MHNGINVVFDARTAEYMTTLREDNGQVCEATSTPKELTALRR